MAKLQRRGRALGMHRGRESTQIRDQLLPHVKVVAKGAPVGRNRTVRDRCHRHPALGQGAVVRAEAGLDGQSQYVAVKRYLDDIVRRGGPA